MQKNGFILNQENLMSFRNFWWSLKAFSECTHQWLIYFIALQYPKPFWQIILIISCVVDLICIDALDWKGVIRAGFTVVSANIWHEDLVFFKYRPVWVTCVLKWCWSCFMKSRRRKQIFIVLWMGFLWESIWVLYGVFRFTVSVFLYFYTLFYRQR